MSGETSGHPCDCKIEVREIGETPVDVLVPCDLHRQEIEQERAETKKKFADRLAEAVEQHQPKKRPHRRTNP